MKIRPAYLTDITGIVRFCVERQSKVLGEEDPPVSPNHLRRNLGVAMRDKDTQIFIAITKDGGLAGVLWAWLAGYVWSHERYVTDILFVADQGGNYLINKMLDWAASRNVHRATMQTHLNGGERVKNLYQRKAFREVGSVFERNQNVQGI